MARTASSFIHRIQRTVCVLAIAYIASLALVGCLQRDLLYHPSHNLSQPAAYGLDMEEHLVKTTDGESLVLWYGKSSPNLPTMIYFHGNAGHIGHRAGRFAAILERGYGLLAVSYRGYGRSTGQPTEDGMYADARAALAFLQTQGLKADEVIYRGESLGTGVAVQLASEHPPLLLALEAPYSSITETASHHYPWVPVKIMLQDRYDSLSKITHVTSPVIIFHGVEDGIIPAEQAQTLYDAVTAEKRLHLLEGTGHSNIDQGYIIREITAFLRELGKVD